MAQAMPAAGGPPDGAGIASFGGRETAAGHRSLWSDALRRLARNRLAIVGCCVIVLLAVGAVAAPQIAPYNPTNQELTQVLSAPSAHHLFGTDQLGRDAFSRL